MSNVNFIVLIILCIIHIKQNRFASNEITDQRNLILVLVAVLSNEGSGVPVHKSR